MNQRELSEYSAYLVEEYYQNNIQPFLNAFSEQCIWLGPAQGQIIHTKKALISAFSYENNQLTFDIQNMHIVPILVNDTCIDIILIYTILSYYPNGETISFQQRTELLWVEESITDSDGNTVKDYFIRTCHISNEFPYDTRDTIYPNHFNELDIAKIYTGRIHLCKFSLKGLYNSCFYLSGDTIMWMESKKSHTLIHTINRVYESVETLTTITQKYPESLLKVHSSYSINPMYVSCIGRFYVQMDDGKRISIPEKKYTKTRDEINQRIEKSECNISTCSFVNFIN